MPISAFAHSLRAFRSGHLGFEDLASEIDRQLSIERASPTALLEILNAHQASQAMPRDAHDALVKKLAEWPRDPTIITGADRVHRTPGAVPVGVGDILLGRFSLSALIGEGGMSRVFKAIDLRRAEAGAIDPHVAVKVLSEPFDEYFGSIVALQREAHKLQTLTHQNIVRVFDCDRDDRTVFMTMEYLEGRSLQNVLRSAAERGLPLDADEAFRLIYAIGEALEFAHENHIVHGDLKPGNVILTREGSVKVIDFGMAPFIKAVTLRYASPQLAAGQAPEPDDDVFALACIAYEALSGEHPFGPGHDGVLTTRLMRPPGMAMQQYSALARALAFEVKDRTPGVRRFLEELSATRTADRVRWTMAAAAAGLLLTGIMWYWHHRATAAPPLGTAPVDGLSWRNEYPVPHRSLGILAVIIFWPRRGGAAVAARAGSGGDPSSGSRGDRCAGIVGGQPVGASALRSGQGYAAFCVDSRRGMAP